MTQELLDPLTVQMQIVDRLLVRGWAVFPIKHGDKVPTGHWPTMAASTPTPDLLTSPSWFGEVRNIGIACGPSGLVVIDEDIPGAFDKLVRAAGTERDTPETYTVETAKGRHFYFEAPEHPRLGNAPGFLKRWGMDVRGEGGYVVADGSLHPSGAVYRVLFPEAEVRPLPDWLIDMITEKVDHTLDVRSEEHASPLVERVVEPRTPFTRPQAEEYARGARERLLASREGDQNNLLNDYALILGHFTREDGSGFFTPAQAQRELLKAAQECGYYFRDSGGADRTVRSGLVAGMADPYLLVIDAQAGSAAATGDLPEGMSVEDVLGSWAPRDITDAVMGNKVRPTTSCGAQRSDGMRFLYPGREHMAMGETESGKSWFGLLCCAQEVEAGHDVLYLHFEEEDEVETVSRLVAMGVRPDLLLRHFRFVGPASRITSAVVEFFAQRPPAVVVIDGVNEAMSLHGLAIREEDGAATLRRVLVKPFTAMGAAVVSLDHVVKDKDARGEGYALGSVHKVNGLDGAAFLLETVDAFGEGKTGKSRIYTVKDRPGSLRKFGMKDRIYPKKFWMGDLTVDGRVAGRAVAQLWAPVEEGPSEDDVLEARHAKVLRAVRALGLRGHQATQVVVEAEVGGNRSGVRESLAWLATHGRLEETRGARGARIFVVKDALSNAATEKDDGE